MPKIPVVAAALIDGAGRVLMQRRPPGSAQGGLWEFPGGKVEPGESEPAALARELAEELDIAVDPAALERLTSAEEPGNPYVITLYLCRQWQGTPRCLAGAAIAWTAREALLDLALPPLDVPLARSLLTVI